MKAKTSLVVAMLLGSFALVIPNSPRAAARVSPSPSQGDNLAQIAAAHNGYVVTGKDLSDQYARAVVARLRCQDEATCEQARHDQDAARSTLLHRGHAVLNAAEPSSNDPIFKDAEVAIYPGDSGGTVINARLPLSVLPSSVLSAPTSAFPPDGERFSARPTGTVQLRVHPDGVTRTTRKTYVNYTGCDPNGPWCYASVDATCTDNMGGETLHFDFNMKYQDYNTDPAQVWGLSPWQVYGSSGAGYWYGLGYTNQANSNHSQEYQTAQGQHSSGVGLRLTTTITYAGDVRLTSCGQF